MLENEEPDETRVATAVIEELLENVTNRSPHNAASDEKMDISSLYNMPNAQVDGCINIQAPGKYYSLRKPSLVISLKTYPNFF